MSVASAIERRIVQMRFDNGQFEKGAEQSLKTLDKLDGVLDKLGSGGGLDKISSALDKVEDRFSTFGIAGAAAIERITNSVINLGAKILTAIPNQIITGGWNRAANIEQARFQLKGLGVEWEEVSDAIDIAVKDTAYGMDEAAVAASQFAASYKSTPEFWQETTEAMKGYDKQVSKMAVSLRAISGVAGMTNSSYSEIADIFTTVVGNGKLMTGEMRRLEARGLNVAATLADVLRDGPGNIKYTEEQIREMVRKGEIDFYTFASAMDYAFGEHAKDANSTFNGALANMKAALSRIGADFATPIRNAGIVVFNAFREMFNRVRKITQPFAESVFTGWMERLGPAVKKVAESVKFDWLRGLIYMLEKIDITPLENALNWIAKFNDSFHSLFDYKSVYDDPIRKGLAYITNPEAKKRVDNLKKAFDGLMAVAELVGRTFRAVGNYLKSLSGGVVVLLDKVLDLAGAFGDWLKQAADGVSYGPKLSSFFTKVGKLAEQLGRSLRAVGDILQMAFSAIWNGAKKVLPSLEGLASTFGGKFYQAILKCVTGLANWLERIRDGISEHRTFQSVLEGLEKSFATIKNATEKVSSSIENFFRKLLGIREGQSVWERFREMFTGFGGKISYVLSQIGNAIQGFFSGGAGVDSVVKASGTIIGALMAWRKIESVKWKIERFRKTIDMLKKGLRTFFGGAEDIANGPDAVVTMLRRTSGALRAFADNLNAKSLVTIGLAVVVLAAGLKLLSTINANDLGNSLFGLVVILMMVVGAFTAISLIAKRIMGGKGLKGLISGLFNAKIVEANSKALLFLAAGILAVAAAVWILSKADPDRLGAALASMLLIIAAMTAALAVLSKNASLFNLAAISAELIAFGVAMLLLSASLIALSFVPWKKLFTAVGALSVMIIVMTAAMKVLSSSKYKNSGAMAAAGLSILMIAAALTVLSVALIALSFIPWKNLMKSVVTMAATLLVLAVVLRIMSEQAFNPVNMIAGAVAMILVAAAIVILSAAMLVFAAIPTDALIKGGIAIAAMLVAMAFALTILSEIAPMAVVAAAAFLILGAALLLIGGAIAVASLGMIALAVALNMLRGFKAQELKEIGKGLKYIGRGMRSLGTGAILMSLGIDAFAALVPLAAALSTMQGLDMKTIGPGMKAVGRGLQAIGIGGALLGLGSLGIVAGVPALTALSSALPGLADGFRSFQSVRGEELIKVCAALGEAILALLLLDFVSLYDATPILLNFAGTLPDLAVGFQSFQDVDGKTIGNAFLGLAAGLGALIGLDFVRSTVDPEKLGQLGAALVAFVPGLQAMQTVAIGDIGKTFLGLTEAVAALLGLNMVDSSVDPSKLKDLGEALPALANGIKAYEEVAFWDLVKMFTGVANGVRKLMRVDTTDAANLSLIAAGLIDVASAIAQIPDNAEDIITGLSNGIRAQKGKPAQAIKECADAIISTLNAYNKNWEVFGGNISVGIANGIYSKAYLPVNAAASVARSVQNSFTRINKIRSPSKVFAEYGGYLMAGLSEGIQNGSDAVTESMIVAISPAMIALQQMLNGDYSMAPTITPVVDIGEVGEAARTASGMFANVGSIASVGNYGQVSATVEHSIRNQSEMRSYQVLADKMDALETAITNMQIILDTGELVGATSAKMDKRLGIMAMRRGRGN